MKSFIFLTVLNFLFATLSAYSNNSEVQRKYSTYYYQRATFFEKLPVDSDDILFVGNSITDGGEWGELFDNPNVKNRGISGDTTYGVYDRISTLLKGKPAQIFLMIGINNVPQGENAEVITQGVRRIVSKIKKESPDTEILIQSVLPVNPDLDMFHGHTSKWKMIPEINSSLKKMTSEENLKYIDLFEKFVNDEGKMNVKYTNDGIHLLGEGYMLWKSIVEPYIRK